MFDQARHKFRVGQKAGLNDTDDQVVRGWLRTTGGGAPVIGDSFNVFSITDAGPGNLTVTWDRDFASANYAVVATVESSAQVALTQVSSVAAGSVSVLVNDISPGAVDPTEGYMVIALGDLT